MSIPHSILNNGKDDESGHAILREFFAALFPDDSGLLEIRALRHNGGKQAFFAPRDVDGISQFIASHAERDLCFGMAARRTKAGGSLKNCGALHTLFCDIDFKTTPEPEARAKLERFLLNPSIVVHSGGGFHVYWLLNEPLDLQHPKGVRLAYSLLRRLALALGGDPNVAEPARILRIPGTLNHKYSPVRRVLVESFSVDLRYNIGDLDDLLPLEPEASGNGIGRFTLPDEIAEGDPGRDNMLYRFGRKLKCAGLTEAEITHALLAANAERCKPPLPEECVREKARHAAEQADRADFEPNGNPGGSEKREQVREGKGDGRLIFTTIGDLLAEPEEQVGWVVDQRLPSAGLSLLAGKPKAGKSTLARCLALAVARGEDWLGFNTTQGTIFYLALEEKRAEVRKHFAAMGTTADDPIHVFIAPSPTDGIQQLRIAAEQEKPALIIIDPIVKFTRVKDLNDYAQVTAALEPLLTLARETGAHVLAVHHLGKGDRTGGDAILGSTALFAAVDTALLLKRSEHYRTLSSIQRYGEDLEEITLTLDSVTKTISAGPSRKEADQAKAEQAILDFLKKQGEPVEREVIEEAIEGRTSIKRHALKLLVEQQKITRSGKGAKGDPYKYLFLVPIYIREQENKKRKNDATSDEHGKDSRSHENTGSDDSARTREQETEISKAGFWEAI